MYRFSLIFCLLPLTGLAQSSDEYLTELIKAYEGKVPLAASYPEGLAEASTTQKKFVAHLSTTMGKAVGYKAALTNAGARKKFGVEEPVLGILLKEMLYDSGAKLPIKFGTLPLLEGDLMVRVGSDDINKAQTHEELLAALDGIVPFIELPDLLFERGTILNGATLKASNAGARLGVKGQPLTIEATAASVDALDKIRLEITDSANKVVGYGYTKALMNHPLNVVKWIRDTLLKRGEKLKKGDLLSLGSITRMIPITGAETYTLTYYGIPGHEKVSVSVSFEE